ncbi:MAG: hypothetical protein UT05_C0001G0113 [Parcubacteria group bacterium GW2011_GWF2_38_76]|nr:MAG: hypothetical protein UT05_C0001G0113 [Parcubacteria group bacterium GW2011_GWF2_38_76]HBM45911.1 hypothetical protein [Patescibacteria group bacterium]
MQENNPYIYGETFKREAPKPNSVVYNVLSDHLKESDGYKIESHVMLNDTYKVLEGSEREISTILGELENKKNITREDVLVLTVLLAVSRTLGPNLGFLREAIRTGHFDIEETRSQIMDTSLNENITNYLQKIIPSLQR